MSVFVNAHFEDVGHGVPVRVNDLRDDLGFVVTIGEQVSLYFRNVQHAYSTFQRVIERLDNQLDADDGVDIRIEVTD